MSSAIDAVSRAISENVTLGAREDICSAATFVMFRSLARGARHCGGVLENARDVCAEMGVRAEALWCRWKRHCR